jgi:hypothetical protein
VTELPDGLPDAPVPAAPSPLPDLRRADEIPQAPRASDASVDAHPDAVADEALPALAAVMCVEKLAVLVLVALAQVAKAHSRQALPAEVTGLYIQDAGRSAA